MVEQRKISDYAFLGDCLTSALVRDGSVDWLCVPQFDSPSVFAAILDSQNGGAFSIRPAGPYRTGRHYDEGTHVLVSRFASPSGEVELTDCLAVHASPDEADTLDPVSDRALVRLVRCTSGQATLDVAFDPRPDYARAEPEIAPSDGRWVVAAAGQRLVLDSD